MNHTTYNVTRKVDREDMMSPSFKSGEFLRHIKHSMTLQILDEVIDGPFAQLTQKESEDMTGMDITVRMTLVNPAKYELLCKLIRHTHLILRDPDGKHVTLEDLI